MRAGLISKDRPNTLWPIGSKFTLVDAWGNDPVQVKRVSVATADKYVVADDARGVRYYAHTDRIIDDGTSDYGNPEYEGFLQCLLSE